MTLKGYEGRTSLSTAASCGHLDVVKYILSKGANINMVDNSKYTPLHAASKEGHLHVVEYLVNAGADINAASHNSYTPLSTALIKGRQRIVEFLMTIGKPSLATETSVSLCLRRHHQRATSTL